MIMWVSVGVLALLGALCYVELGLIIPKTGGEYAIFDYVYGPRFAFMFAWVSLFELTRNCFQLYNETIISVF